MKTQIQIGRMYNSLEAFNEYIQHTLHPTLRETKLTEILTLLTEAVDVLEERINVQEEKAQSQLELQNAKIAKAEAVATKAITLLESLSEAAEPKKIRKAIDEMKTAANELQFLKSKL